MDSPGGDIGHHCDDGDHMEMEKCVSCPRLIRCLQLLFEEDLEWNGVKILQVLTQIPLLPNEYYTNTIAAKKNMRKVVLRDGFKYLFVSQNFLCDLNKKPDHSSKGITPSQDHCGCETSTSSTILLKELCISVL